MNFFIQTSTLLPPIIWIALSSALFATGDIVLRFWISTHSNLTFILGLGIISIGMFFLSMSFPSQNIAVATVVSILLNISLYLLLAFFIFGDIITIKESIGLIVGFLAIFILEALK